MLGKKIKELRKEKNITQQDLANALNITRQSVQKWEADKSDPDLSNIKLICQYFNITIDELMNFDLYDYNFEYEHNGTKLIHKERNNKK